MAQVIDAERLKRMRKLRGLTQDELADGQPSAPADEIAYQLNVRVDAAIRNAFELVARRYGVSVPKIAQLAPLLFVIIAEASLKHRRKKLDEFEAALDRISELGSHLPHFPASCFYGMDDQEQSIKVEKKSIDGRDLFGLNRFDPYGVDDKDKANPFVAYVKALTAGRDDITVRSRPDLDRVSGLPLGCY